MLNHRHAVVLVVACAVAAGLGPAGCLVVDTPDKIVVGGGGGREPIDTSRLPPTGSEEEARQKLAAAYKRIDYLEDKVRDLQEDKRELKDERDEYKDKYKREKKRNDD